MFPFKAVLLACLFSVLITDASSHGILTPILHTAPKLALGSLHLAGKSLGSAVRIIPPVIGIKKILIGKKLLLAKPLIVKGLIINHFLKKNAKKKVYVGKSYVAKKSTGYGSGGARSEVPMVEQPAVAPILQRVVPSITFPEVNVPVRLSIGSGNNNNRVSQSSFNDGFGDNNNQRDFTKV